MRCRTSCGKALVSGGADMGGREIGMRAPGKGGGCAADSSWLLAAGNGAVNASGIGCASVMTCPFGK